MASPYFFSVIGNMLLKPQHPKSYLNSSMLSFRPGRNLSSYLSPSGKGDSGGLLINLFSIKSPLTPLYQRGVQKDSRQAGMTTIGTKLL